MPLHARAPGELGSPPGRGSPYLTFVLLSASLLVYVMQFGMVSVALQDLIRDLSAPLRWSGWVLTIFMIGQVIALSVSGRLAERFGPRNVFAAGLGLFSLASLICATAPDIYVLIGGRLIQGLGGGSLMPSGTAMVAAAFPASRARAVGLYSSILPFGAVFGPTVGGLIVDAAGWRWTFLMNAPLGLIVMLAVLMVLPRGDRKPPQPIDVAGVIVLALAVASLILALTELGRTEPGPDLALVAVSSGLSVLFWVLLAFHERRVHTPALDIALLARPDILASNATAFVVGMAWIGVFSMVPLYLQESYEMSASLTGALMAPRAAAMVGFSLLAALLLHRTRYRWPIALGLVGMGLSLGLLGLGLHDPSIGPVRLDSSWWLLAVILLAGASRGITNPSLNNTGMDALPDRVASIAGLRATFQSFGGTVGISVMVLLGARGSDLASGMQVGFLLDGALLIGALALVPLIPEPPHRG
ncbi:MAG: MFS transporter [Dehalococcoidia bacterium]|nr:MFS transporter [Dehalococcoidia bacterium]